MDTFRTHPDFFPATERCARGLVGMYRGHRLLNRILNDRGRVVFGLFALYLDATPDENGVGLTVTRIATLCQETNVCSRGRAKAMVMLMRWAGYLDIGGETGPNRRQRPLVPTPRLLQEQINRWRQLCGALAMLHPPAEDVLARIEDPVFARTLVREIGSRFHAGVRLLHYAPQASVFAERDAGILIAMSLLISGAEGDAFPPEQPVPVPVAALARQFFVSRAHVLKLMREAEQEGLIARTPSPTGSVHLLEPLRSGMVAFFAAMFSVLADAGDAALVAAGEAPSFPASAGGQVFAPRDQTAHP
ncbi:hypothetical protein ABLE91_15075 [Aquabacter sp. CN5-332]|uniref:hypothetical protein n=1 Tax=Aquabacter sp. CN5-332 TaxID=3156608 RepID=UPI0032B4E4C5